MQIKKIQFNFLQKAIQQNENKKTYRFIASTETIDRAGEKILLSAWDLSHYKKNPVILYGHDNYSLENVVGVCVATEINEKEFIIDVQFSESNPKGKMIENMLDEGMSLAVSVGFIPDEVEVIDGVTTIIKAKLLEVSMVILPCNPDAVMKMKSLAIKNNVTDFEIKEDVAKVGEVAPVAPIVEVVNNPIIAEVKPEPVVVEEIIKDENLETGENDDNEIEIVDELDSDEEIEVEIVSENESEELDIEIDDSVDNTSDEKAFMLELDLKEGRKLSKETLISIAQVKSFAEEGIKNFNSLVAALDNLVIETGDKTLIDDFITIRKSDLKELQLKVRGGDKSIDEGLSVINRILNNN